MQEYKLISSRRIACFYSSEPQPQHFTILVRGIPASGAKSFSESVDDFFREYHPSTYLSHTVVRRTSRLQQLINDAEKLYRTLAHMETEGQTTQQHDYSVHLPGNRAHHLNKLEKRLEVLEVNMRKEQSSLYQKLCSVGSSCCFRIFEVTVWSHNSFAYPTRGQSYRVGH